jgi:uncharacterized protein YacL
MLNKTTGMAGLVIGLILAIVGAITWFGLNHHKLGPGLLVLGVIVLAVGGYAFMASGKTAGAR